MKVAVVVDSSAGLPPAVALGQQITVVPLSVKLAGRRVLETELSVEDVLSRLEAGEPLSVRTPGRDALADCYRALGAAGYDEVVSIHLPETLSPLVLQARGAAELMRDEDQVTVHVVDGQVAAMGLGWVALTAAGAAAAAMTGQEVRDLAVMTAARSMMIYAAGDAEHHRRLGGGSVRRSIMGSVTTQPVLRLQRGELNSAGNPLSLGRALDRVVEIAQDNGRGWPVHVTVQHAQAPERAHTLRERLLDTDMPVRGDISIVPVSPTVAAYCGVGTVGVAMSPAEWITAPDPFSTSPG